MSRRCFRLLLTLKPSTYSGPGLEEDPGKVRSVKGMGWFNAALARKGLSGAGSGVSAEFISVDAIPGKAIWVEANGSMPESIEA